MSPIKILITAYAAAVLALLSTQATAYETRKIAEYGDWTTQIELTDAGDLFCAAVVPNAKGETFEVIIDEYSDVSVFLVFNNTAGNVSDGPLDVVIEGSVRWSLEDFSAFEHSAIFTFSSPFKGAKFIEHLQKGISVGIASPGSDDVFGAFSLRGSTQALKELVNCYAKIRGEPA